MIHAHISLPPCLIVFFICVTGFSIAQTHHGESGTSPDATHVYVAAYVSERWFYLDPTEIAANFPDYARRHSIGVGSFSTVNYEHPYVIIPVPLSGFDGVPYLPA